MNRNEIRIKPQDGIFRKMGIKNVEGLWQTRDLT